MEDFFMETKFEIEVKEPTASDMLCKPVISFRLIQLNMTPECITEGEIDFQADQLIEKVEKLRKTAKKKLKEAKLRHDKLLSVKREKN
jgi:hypothetical protein